MAEELPVRYCHGCKQYDDHPRVTHIRDSNRPDLDELFHYDCAPAEVVADPVVQPILESVGNGTKGAELREVAAAHAVTIKEAPADKKGSSK